MTRFRLTVEYDGRPFMGWQRQAHGPSVQQAIEEALERVTGHLPVVHASGRTDAGVHARGQVAHVDLDYAITPFRLSAELTAHLRQYQVEIIDYRTVTHDWPPPFSCLGRASEYPLANSLAPR